MVVGERCYYSMTGSHRMHQSPSIHSYKEWCYILLYCSNALVIQDCPPHFLFRYGDFLFNCRTCETSHKCCIWDQNGTLHTYITDHAYDPLRQPSRTLTTPEFSLCVDTLTTVVCKVIHGGTQAIKDANLIFCTSYSSILLQMNKVTSLSEMLNDRQLINVNFCKRYKFSECNLSIYNLWSPL